MNNKPIIWQMFSGYERVVETELDFAQARYFVSITGRFSSPDPLLSSGRTANPQTWNRYAYVLGNPLKSTDPLGLWEWSDELGGSTTSEAFEGQLETLRASREGKSKKEKKAINAQINRIKGILSRRTAVLNGMKIAREAANNLSGSEKDAVNATLDAYGSQYQNNGVIIGVGSETLSDQGVTGIEEGSVIVAIRPDEFSADTLFMTIAHEGSHVLDAKEDRPLA
jgi:RHS repeat-associated protein